MAKDGKGTSGGGHTSSSKKDQNKLYKFVSKSAEGKKSVFGGAFNLLDTRFSDLFACVCGNRLVIYKCSFGMPTERMQVYVDEDDSECFYTVTWLRGAENGAPLLAASGSSGVIRIIDASTQQVVHSLTGHGGSVNELRVHPRIPELFISGSKDESLRLWNSTNGVCALVLGGARGHRNEVLSADFHPLDKGIIASCGMDGSIRVWSLHHWWNVVELSKTWQQNEENSGKSFPTRIVQYPIFVVQKVHTNYVDCLRWLGNFFLTKSVDEEVVLWRWCAKSDNSGPAEGVVDILNRIHVSGCSIWFLKFSLDYSCSLMALGNKDGKTFVFDLSACPPVHVAQLSTKECRSAVRQTAISHCGRTVMCCCDDGTVWRWEKSVKESEKK